MLYYLRFQPSLGPSLNIAPSHNNDMAPGNLACELSAQGTLTSYIEKVF